MAVIDFNLLREPIAKQAVCGPDLDLDADADYMNVMARAEGLLPDSYFEFKKDNVNLASELDALSRIVERSHDLRVLTLIAKLLLFDRNLAAFTSCIEAIAWLLEARWNEVHPADEMGLRAAVLQSLDDLPHVILPLQFVPLFESRRAGNITLRNRLLATGEVKPREGEKALDVGAIDQAAADCDLQQLIAARDTSAALARRRRASLRSAWIGKAGFEEAPDLKNLAKLTEQMVTFLDEQVGRRETPRLRSPFRPPISGTRCTRAPTGKQGEAPRPSAAKPITTRGGCPRLAGRPDLLF